jgi:aspartate/methionine/tyrosine aminotransferase
MAGEETAGLAHALNERRIPLIVDEVFHHLYFGTAQPSAAGLDNAIVVGDMSKSLSLGGLRVGWLIDSDPIRRERMINARNYFTISGSPLTEAFATQALASADAILTRLVTVARTNLERLQGFIESHSSTFGWVRPEGGTMAFLWLKSGRDTRPLCEAWAGASVLVAPGDCFGMPPYLRVGIGASVPEDFEQALAIMSRAMASDTSLVNAH